jgi:hypothetical protein
MKLRYGMNPQQATGRRGPYLTDAVTVTAEMAAS